MNSTFGPQYDRARCDAMGAVEAQIRKHELGELGAGREAAEEVDEWEGGLVRAVVGEEDLA